MGRVTDRTARKGGVGVSGADLLVITGIRVRVVHIEDPDGHLVRRDAVGARPVVNRPRENVIADSQAGDHRQGIIGIDERARSAHQRPGALRREDQRAALHGRGLRRGADVLVGTRIGHRIVRVEHEDAHQVVRDRVGTGAVVHRPRIDILAPARARYRGVRIIHVAEHTRALYYGPGTLSGERDGAACERGADEGRAELLVGARIRHGQGFIIDQHTHRVRGDAAGARAVVNRPDEHIGAHSQAGHRRVGIVHIAEHARATRQRPGTRRGEGDGAARQHR